MLRNLGFALSLSALALACAFGTSSLAQPNLASRLITKPIADNQRVTLAGNTRPEAIAANDRGRVADNLVLDHMQLLLKRSADREQALQQLMAQQLDRKSPNFHHWLTAKEFGDRFGASSADVQAVTGWLTSHGFTVNAVHTNGIVIDFSGTAGSVRGAFNTEIHSLDVNGVKHIANMRDPQIPAALASAVVGVASLHDFMPHPLHKMRGEFTFPGCGTHDCLALVPADLATIYNINPVFGNSITGAGQTVVVIEDTDVYSVKDWADFRNTFGLSAYSAPAFTQVHPGANCIAPGVNGDDVEAILDAEWASAAAPGAAIVLAACHNTNAAFGGLIAFQNLVNSGSPPPIISISYGECEAFNGAVQNAMFNAAYQQAASEGISVFVSSGDEDAGSCDRSSQVTHGIGISGLASTPYNVAVGGTDFGDTYAGTTATYWNPTNSGVYGSALSYIPEIPWNDSCASTLLALKVTGSAVTYGSNGFCNTPTGKQFLNNVGASGGPSGCATGKAAISGVVSGSCKGYAKPSWQQYGRTPYDGVRDIPDVSLFAANGLWRHFYIFCYSDRLGGGTPCRGNPSGWPGAGGTSFSAPILAGIQALVNQRTGTTHGNPNPVYYQIAADGYGAGGVGNCDSNGPPNGSCSLNDVTLGDIDADCTGKYNCYQPSGKYGVLSTSNTSYKPAFSTGTGWDFATGLGTVNAYNLVYDGHW